MRPGAEILPAQHHGRILVLAMQQPDRRNALSPLLRTADHREGKAAFLGRRKPEFKGV